MSDQQDKIGDLRRKLGLLSGADIGAPEKARKKALPEKQPPRPDPSPAGEGEARTLRNRLQALNDRLNLSTAAELPPPTHPPYRDTESGDYEIDQVLPGKIRGEEDHRFFLLREDFPLDFPQGQVSLGEALQAAGHHIAFSARDQDLADFNPKTALFMDTETTGLAGGAGTMAFLVGVGYFTDDAFRLDQCFMMDYDQESAMLEFLAERFNQAETIVGYNSKSFDLPLLRTRFIQNRIPFSNNDLPHYDLVHAARRFFKRRLSDCTLGNIERHILGLSRHGDVPSYLIPQMWFDYLESRDARPLEGVFYHHKMDILSLVALTATLAKALDAPNAAGFDHLEDRFSLLRVYFQDKKYEKFLALAEAFLAEQEETPFHRECLEMMGFAAKRLKRFDKMQSAFEALLEIAPNDLTARHELAKHHEHCTRDLLTAARLCREVLDRYEVQDALGRPTLPLPELNAFKKRLIRIQKKLGKTGGDFEEEIL